MMREDIVGALKKACNSGRWLNVQQYESLMCEAAEEIERLRACLNTAAGMLSTCVQFAGMHPADMLKWIEQSTPLPEKVEEVQDGQE